jgi:arylsulfatase A-like enzyme
MARIPDGISRRMFMNRMTRWTAAGAACAAAWGAGCEPQALRGTGGGTGRGRPPNFVIIFTDDQGYQDLGCFGSPDIETPNIDLMASGGMKFTDFYVAQPVCSASRTALLTGCYPNRVGIQGALGPGAKHGISDGEMTLGQVVKQRGYATAAFGKWHLGHHPQFLPLRHGFDEYFGLPYSNDMWPHHPTAKFPPLPLIEGEKVVKPEVQPEDQSQLTTWYAQRAVRFIEANHERPFLLYVAHSMPHVPLFVSDKFAGKSKAGLYGDVIMEIDWSVGQILAALRKHGIEENTLVVFTSDNGPWLSYGDHAGRALPLREGKGTTWDGGVREPTVMRWPGRIPAGTVCREPVMTIDLLPTIARLAGAPLPPNRIDGLDIWPLMAGQDGAKTPHEALFFYWNGGLEGVRSGRWKLHFAHPYRTLGGKPGGTGGKPGPYETAQTPLALYDMERDPSETTNVADANPDVVKRLTALADAMRKDLGDTLTKTKGDGAREPGRV